MTRLPPPAGIGRSHQPRRGRSEANSIAWNGRETTPGGGVDQPPRATGPRRRPGSRLFLESAAFPPVDRRGSLASDRAGPRRGRARYQMMRRCSMRNRSLCFSAIVAILALGLHAEARAGAWEAGVKTGLNLASFRGDYADLVGTKTK